MIIYNVYSFNHAHKTKYVNSFGNLIAATKKLNTYKSGAIERWACNEITIAKTTDDLTEEEAAECMREYVDA